MRLLLTDKRDIDKGSKINFEYSSTIFDAKELAIMKSISYADIFDHPLTFNELYKFIMEENMTKFDLKTILNNKLIPKYINKKDRYYFLPKREFTINLRKERTINSKIKWDQAYKSIHLLKMVPFIKMISITGSLALNNVQSKNDDIDLFIVTEEGHLWLPRLFVVALAKILNLVKINLCANYLITEKALKILNQNSYSAREIKNMIPVLGSDIYEKFIQQNNWINLYFPNSIHKFNYQYRVNPNQKKPLLRLIIEKILGMEFFLKIEKYEMNRQIKKLEKISNSNSENHFSQNCCKSHIHGHGNRIAMEFDKRIKLIKELRY